MFRFCNSALLRGYAHHKPSRRRARSTSRIHRKRVTKHWVSTFGLLLRRFVLNDIPVLDQNSVFDANDVRGNPVHRRAEAREPPVEITRSPSARITPGSYFSVGGMLLMRLNRPSRPG